MNDLMTLQQIASKAIVNHGTIDVANLILEGLLKASDSAVHYGDDLIQVTCNVAAVRLATLVPDY